MYQLPQFEFSQQESSALILASKFSVEIPTAVRALSAQASKIADRPLETEFVPGENDVVCGRGKGSYNRIGNKKFRELVTSYIPAYLKARTKFDKSTILHEIIDKVRAKHNPDTGRPANFVKFHKKTGWTEIGEGLAREKVGHAMREAIATTKRGKQIKPAVVVAPVTSAQLPSDATVIPTMFRRTSTNTILKAIRRTSDRLSNDNLPLAMAQV